MNEHQPHAEPRELGAALDANGGLDVAGPTARQELLLRRQQLWTADLTREEASSIIGDFLARKHAVDDEDVVVLGHGAGRPPVYNLDQGDSCERA